MGIVNTKKWLIEHAQEPIEVCEKLVPYFEGSITSKELYKYLQHFGMYRLGMNMKYEVEELVDRKIWDEIEGKYLYYKKLWNGPDIPVFILPLRKYGLFAKGHNKSGLAYPDKLFLFISSKSTKYEREALLIHEYHHVCRLNTQKKKINEYTLRDSCILEGLAEYTVQHYLGEKFLAPWIDKYKKETLQTYIEGDFKKLVEITRKDKIHDQFMYGNRKWPAMIGYCIGYHLVKSYFQEKSFSAKISFSLPSEKIIKKSF